MKMPATLVFAALLVLAASGPTKAGEPGGFFHALAAPVRALHREKPRTCQDELLEQLVREVDWLDNQLRAYGSIVAKHPDVWGQNRLARHRAEYEAQLQAQLGGFQELSHASLRRSDQSFLGLAMALGQTPAPVGRAAVARPIDVTTNVTNLISDPVGGGPAGQAVIARSPPFAATAQPFATFGLDNSSAVGLEPTIHLDHVSQYVNHLQQLRRINEGDDIADSPGYSLNLVRIPVSLNPGHRTQAGHGAEITLIADPQLGPDLLPTTFQSLVLNDVIDILAPGLTFAVNIPAVRDSLALPTPAAATTAAVRGMRSRTVSVPTAKMRRARMPLPPEQVVDVIGERQIVVLLENAIEALAADPANSPCIRYADVRSFLAEELKAAWAFLAQPRQRQAWDELSSWNLAELIRSHRLNELELRRRVFFDSLGIDDALPVEITGPTDRSESTDLADSADSASGACMGPCSNNRSTCRICQTTTAVLAWAILVESALLNERLAEDMRESGSAQGISTISSGMTSGMTGPCAGPFYGPDPSPEARTAFNDYVRRRWPIRVFAVDPVNEEQNVADQYAERREMQVAMALAVASGRSSGQALARYARRLETDLATIALNKTAVGFTHGADTFGWRFYPRIQSPPTRSGLGAFTDTICGTPAGRDLATRRIEPGIRECTALVVMPSFVPYVTFDVSTCWFSLTHPKATDQSMRQTLLLSRSIKSMQHLSAEYFRCATCYRDGDPASVQRKIATLDRQLPLQTMQASIPYENTAGGFELFNTGVTDLAPELVGWYGAQGVDPAGPTTLFLIGKGFSVHDTNVIAGGRPVKTHLISRQLLQVEIPPGVQTILPAQGGGCGADNRAAASRRHGSGIRLASNSEPLPAPLGQSTEPPAKQSLRLTLPGSGLETSSAASQRTGDCGCGTACHAREVVDLYLATPYGVSGHLLIPITGAARDFSDGGSGFCNLVFSAGNLLRLTATPTKAGTWRVNEFFASAQDAIRISVPSVFAAPPKAVMNFTLRDSASGVTAGTFSIPAAPFDARAQEYVLAGADLRNFIGDTSRPATDKTLRGAIKPYLDSLGSGNCDLTLKADLVTDQKTIPIDGTIAIEVRQNDQPSDPIDSAP